MYFILITALIFLTIILAFWAIADVLKSTETSSTFKVVCFIFILISPIFGSILYFQLGKKRMQKKPRTFNPDFQKKKS